jgi:hypothetical protein
MALSFNAMPTDFGSYPLSIYYKIESDSIAASLLILDGDGIEDTYNPTEDIQTSYVEVLSYTKNSLEGICSVEFSLDGNLGNLDNPAIYNFTNGRLSITVP